MRFRHMLGRLREEKRPARFLASRILRATRLCSLFTIQRDGFRLRFYPTAGSATLWLDPSPCREEQFLASFLRPGDTYIDVGANIGALALKAAAIVGRSGSVNAFEAHPRTFRFLQGNLRLNGFRNVTAVNRALSDKPGVVRFTDLHTDDQNSIRNDGAISVEAARLDDVIQAQGPVALLKIDVEGAEKMVLEGAPRTLARTRAVYFEYSDRMAAAFGYGMADLRRILESAGFRIERVGGNEAAADYLAVRA